MPDSNNPLDPVVREAFTTAVVTTFEQLTNVVFTAVDGGATIPEVGDYSVYLELQRSIPGVVAMTMPRSLVATLANRLFSSSQQPSPELYDDALREFINVIAGQAKTMLKGTAYHYMLSLPQSGFPTGEVLSAIHFRAVEGGFVLGIRLAACE